MSGVERPKYRSLDAVLVGRRPLAAWLEVDGARAWLPRTCLDTLTDKAVDAAEIGDAIRARVMVWKADQLGWTGRPADHPKLL